jgi:hypothetical protein
MSKSKISVLLLLVVLLTAACALAQSSAGFGAISGSVTDPSGAVVSGAKVVVANTSKGIRRDLETSSAGVFVVPNLVPADGYTVTVSKAGFQNYQVKDITINVGQTITLSPSLVVGSASTSIEVTSEAPIIDQSKTGVSQVVDSNQILNLPINGRRVDNFVLLTPGVTNDFAFGLLSFRGNPGGNNFLTDGVDTTNSYYGENAGRTRTYNIAQDAVQEFQVVSSNYAAEFGKASGGVVNTVTRSGTNRFHGSAYEFFRNRTLNAVDRTTVSGLAPNGINPPEWRHQAGLSIGGPIKKDKLFFFFNGELFRRNAPIVSSNLGAGAGNNLYTGAGVLKAGQPCVPGGSIRLPSTSSSGAGTPGPTAAQCDAATAYVLSRVIPQLIPRHMDNNMAFGKIDWHPSEKDSFSFSGNYVDFRSPNGIQTQLSLTNGNAIGNNADTNVFDRTGRASWTHIVTPAAVNEFRFGIFKDRQIDPASPSLLPSFGGISSPANLSVNSVSNLGYATNYPRINPSELRVEMADNFSWTKGQHNLKFGANFSHQEDFVISMLSQYPSYTYSATTASTGGAAAANALTLLALDFSGNTPAGKQAWSNFSQTVGNRQVDLALWEISLYGQDEWHITPKLTITPGLRYEHSGVPQPQTCNPRFPLTCKIPTTNGNLAPRIGFAYSIFDKTVVRGGYGIFNNRYLTSGVENLLVSTGNYQNAYSYASATATNACLPSFPAILPWDWTPPAACAKTLAPNVIFSGPNYRPSYSQQANIALEREIAKNTSLSLSYVWSRSLHIQVSRDDNAILSTKTLTYNIADSSGALTGQTYTTPMYLGGTTRNPAYFDSTGAAYAGRVSVLESSANSYYNALFVNLRHRYSNWFQGDLSYTWSHTIDWGVGFGPTFGSTTPSSYINGNYRADKGSSQLDRRHNLVINAVISPTFMHSSSVVARYLVNGWQLGTVNVFASSQPQVPQVSGSLFLSPGATAALGGTAVYNTFSLNGLGGSSRVPFLSTSALDVGSLFRTDVRLTKSFPVTERVKVMLGFETFNLLNHLIVSGRDSAAYTLTFPTTGTYAAGGANYGQGLLTPRASYGAISTTQVTPDGTTARRADVVIRITF